MVGGRYGALVNPELIIPKTLLTSRKINLAVQSLRGEIKSVLFFVSAF